MKKASLIFTVLVFCFAASCKKKDDKKEETTDCSGVTYSATVSPIIASNCAIPSCHNAGSTNGPGPLTNYQQVKASASSIRAAVNAGTMPKGSSLTNTQKNNIICWIDNGAANN